jgi:AcrR family transcriptional regulator
MPTPARTSLAAIVRAGRDILESDGLEGLTMQRVAERVGVRPPSLYKRVRGRGELIRLMGEAAFIELGETLEQAASSGDAAADLRAIATSFRGFARAQPRAYGLLFGVLPDEWRPAPEAYQGALQALFRVIAGLAAPDEVLEAARTVVAWAHGFVSMENAGAFRLGGDVDQAFAFGVDRLAVVIGSGGSSG